MKKRILHIASFIGNIGDNANHDGFRKNLRSLLGCECVFDEIEIRDFYFNVGKRFFDDDFIEEANTYDLVVFGGGNFLEISFPKSKTGTTFNIGLDVLDKLKTKFFINGVGFDPEKGAGVDEIRKFEKLIDFMANDDRFFVTFRNDGSSADFERIYPNKDYSIGVVPDGGFFYTPVSSNCDTIDASRKYIAINIAGDMLDLRFNQKTGSIPFSQFVLKFSEMMNNFLNDFPEYDLVFTAHIYKDYSAIIEILNSMDDMIVRKRVRVAPHIQGNGYDAVFNVYKGAELTIANRFHANVCAFAMNIPTIAVSNYPKIKKLYTELELDDRIIDVTQNGFEVLMRDKIVETIENREAVVDEYQKTNNRLEQDLNAVYNKLHKWMM